jgi:hypothetical protein
MIGCFRIVHDFGDAGLAAAIGLGIPAFRTFTFEGGSRASLLMYRPADDAQAVAFINRVAELRKENA